MFDEDVFDVDVDSCLVGTEPSDLLRTRISRTGNPNSSVGLEVSGDLIGL